MVLVVLQLRALWAQYFKQSDAIAFVVDSSDTSRLDDESSAACARLELHKLLDAEELKNKPLIILCNKQDLPNALMPNEVTERLGITKLTDRDWTVQATCALGGDGLALALDWLVDTVMGQKST
jgi:GTPase SAR1 family protein